MNPAIEFDHVTKRYRIGGGFPSLKAALSGRARAGENAGQRIHWAVKDLTFQLAAGDSLGIIGPNGAGKTTTLKLLSRVTRPTSGTIHFNGRMSALIELGAGFHPDLSGRENVFLNGAILGMPRAEIQRRFDEIVDFSGIETFIDTPVKRYSSGMYARLGFAIAAHVDPDILLVDEVLAVGDFAFQTKCYARMDALRKQGTALIFVSHNMDAVRRVCNRGLVMYRGQAIFQGEVTEAVVAYSDAIRQAARASQAGVPLEGGLAQKVMSFAAEIEAVRLLNTAGEAVSVFHSGEDAVLQLDVLAHQDIISPIFAFFIKTPDGSVVYNTTTDWMDYETPQLKAGERCQVEFKLNLPLLDGSYELGADIASADLSHYYDRLERALTFWIKGPEAARGLVDLGAQVALHRLESKGASA